MDNKVWLMLVSAALGSLCISNMLLVVRVGRLENIWDDIYQTIRYKK